MGAPISLEYPVFVIESDPRSKFAGYSIALKQSDFIILGRVPNAERFSRGLIFTADGRVCVYHGVSGWPLFSSHACVLLDSIVLPGILTKILSSIVYYGPSVVSQSHVSIEEFAQTLKDEVRKYEKSDMKQLESILDKKETFRGIIEAVDWFRYHGGARDEDGHPLD